MCVSVSACDCIGWVMSASGASDTIQIHPAVWWHILVCACAAAFYINGYIYAIILLACVRQRGLRLVVGCASDEHTAGAAGKCARVFAVCV